MNISYKATQGHQTLDHWGVVEEQIQRNTLQRINWDEILGVSLTKFCYTSFNKGRDAQNTIQLIQQVFPHLTDKGLEKLRIGVCARYSEYNTHKKLNGGNTMGSIKEEAQAYTGQSVGNIADLKEVQTDLQVEEREGINDKGDKFSYKVVVVEDQEYRVPKSVLKTLKTILEDNPNLNKFKVKKTGQGMDTDYTVIPLG